MHRTHPEKGLRVNAVDERPQPQLRNLSAEAALLGALITNPDALDMVTEHIGAGDFANYKNGIVYSSICMAAIEGTTGLAAIVEQLRKGNNLTDITEAYLYSLTKEACDEAAVRQNVAIVTDLSRKREKIAAANQLAQSLINGEDETIAFDNLVSANEREARTEDGFADLGDTMENIISGNYVKVEPTLLKRSDGKYLLYSGKLNWVSAPPEAMKSFAMLLASIQEMVDHNRPVVYVDFEDDKTTVCERLYRIAIGMGIDDETVKTWTGGPLHKDGTRDRTKALFFYEQRGKAFDTKLRSTILKVVKRGARLVTIDGCATAIALANLNENDNGDVNKWISAVSYPITSAGAAVVVIDHVVKTPQVGGGAFANRSPRGAGSKLAAVSGTALSFEVKEASGVYTEGRIELTVAKDRPGRCVVQKRSGKRIAGVLLSKPILEGREGVSLVIHPADEMAQLAEQKRYDLVAAEHISRIVHELGPISKTEVRDTLKERAEAKGSTGFRSETISTAMKFLTENMYVRINREAKSEMLTSLTEYKSTYGDKHADDIDENPF